MPNPMFPDRPTHLDFERLSQASKEIDGCADEPDFDFQAYTNAIVDLKSLQYMAEQRAGHGIREALGVALTELPIPFQAFIVSTYMDGLVLGALYERAGGHR